MARRAYTTILHDTLARDDDRDVNHNPPLRKSVTYYAALVDSMQTHPLWPDFVKEFCVASTPNKVNPTSAAHLEIIDPVTIANFYRRATGKRDVLPGGFTHQLHPDLHLDGRLVDMLARARYIDIDERGLAALRGVFTVTRWLYDHGEDFILDNTTLLPHGREMDVVIPDRRVGIEISPSSTHHSNAYGRGSDNKVKSPDYHWRKYNDARNIGWSLIHLFSQSLSPTFIDAQLGRIIDEADQTTTTVERAATVVTARSGATKAAYLHQMSSACSWPGREAPHRLLVRDYHGNVVGAVGLDHPTSVTVTGEKVVEIVAMTVPRQYRDSALHKVIAWAGNAGFERVIHVSDNALYPVLDVTGGGFVHLTSLDPRITFVSREDWTDCLPGSVVDVGSAIDGVVACDRSRRGITVHGESEDDHPFDVRRYVECELTNRDGVTKGYDAVFDAGAEVWVADTTEHALMCDN